MKLKALLPPEYSGRVLIRLLPQHWPFRKKDALHSTRSSTRRTAVKGTISAAPPTALVLQKQQLQSLLIKVVYSITLFHDAYNHFVDPL